MTKLTQWSLRAWPSVAMLVLVLTMLVLLSSGLAISWLDRYAPR